MVSRMVRGRMGKGGTGKEEGRGNRIEEGDDEKVGGKGEEGERKDQGRGG